MIGCSSSSSPSAVRRSLTSLAIVVPQGLDAAIATERLRLSGFVFDNDFRHPVVLAMSAGSIDVLSNGRLELGIGAGWLKDDYDQSGIPFDPASVRIARLEEAVQLLKLLLSGERTTFSGEFYNVDGLQIPPTPVQRGTFRLAAARTGTATPRASFTSSASPRGPSRTARRTPPI